MNKTERKKLEKELANKITYIEDLIEEISDKELIRLNEDIEAD